MTASSTTPSAGVSGIAVWPMSCLSGSADYRRERGLPTPAEIGQMARDGIVVYLVDGHTGKIALRITAPTPEQADEANEAGIRAERHARDSAAGRARHAAAKARHAAEIMEAARDARQRTLDEMVEQAAQARTLEGTFHE